MLLPTKQKWSVTHPGPGVTSNILNKLLSALFCVKPASIRSYFSRNGISLSSIEDVAKYIKDRIVKDD